MNVYYFDEPTIGYCPECYEAAIYTDKLRCPKDAKHELSIFTWDGNSKHPEED